MNKKRIMIMLCLVFALMLSTMIVGFCETPTADASVVSAFTDLKGTVAATIAAIAAVAVVIYGTFLAWKYGRKIFATVAK